MTLPSPLLSRRAFLGTSGALAAGAAAAGLLPTRAGAASIPRSSGTAASTPSLAALLDPDPSLHLARRATYGITKALQREIPRVGRAAWVRRQLDPSTIADTRCDSYLERYPLLGLDPGQVASRIPVGHFDQMNQIVAASFVREVWSERQLYEMMVEFWWNHFNIGLPDGDAWNLCGSFDDLIRARALGRFEDLLLGVAHSPAMLNRLNQNVSVGSNPNENYAREMLELHTVGVEAGYTQLDVHHAALFLTGWGLDATGTSFRFTPADHYLGPVKIMGFSSENLSTATAESEILRYLRYLARSEWTARHLATKLCVRFVSDSPPDKLVDRLAEIYLDNETEIVPVLEHLFASDEFYASVGKKVRRPIEALAASLRILDYELANQLTGDLADLVFGLEIMGQQPLGWPQPNGYPDTAAAWSSASFLQEQWGFDLRLSGGWWTETLSFPGMLELLGRPSASMPAGTFVDVVTERLLCQQVTAAHRKIFLSFLDRDEDEPIGSSTLAGTLPLFCQLVLCSPYFAVR
ncbi:MAG TPA: DUF1800 domain-containing protein [Acidimicrobiales bacterium]|nr:DUF1800 domain-containing protein [Acidimicrobiales bacterium]